VFWRSSCLVLCCLPCLCCVGVVCAGVALSVGRLSSSAGIAAMVGLIDCMCLRIVVYCNCFLSLLSVFLYQVACAACSSY